MSHPHPFAALGRFRQSVWPTRPEPETLPEAIEDGQRNRRTIRRLALVVMFTVASIPIVTWAAITAGERGRENVCEVTERAFRGYSDNLTDVLVQVSDVPETPEEQAEQDAAAAALRAGLIAGVPGILEDCG